MSNTNKYENDNPKFIKFLKDDGSKKVIEAIEALSEDLCRSSDSHEELLGSYMNAALIICEKFMESYSSWAKRHSQVANNLNYYRRKDGLNLMINLISNQHVLMDELFNASPRHFDDKFLDTDPGDMEKYQPLGLVHHPELPSKEDLDEEFQKMDEEETEQEIELRKLFPENYDEEDKELFPEFYDPNHDYTKPYTG